MYRSFTFIAAALLCDCANPSDSARPVVAAPPPSVPTAAASASAAPPVSAAATASGSPSAAPAVPPSRSITSKAVPLPDAAAPVSMDYVAADRSNGRIWVPVGDTGSVDVLEIDKGSFTEVKGFKTAEREMHGAKRTVGPSAVTIGDGVAYVGNRATAEVCAVDTKRLVLGKCLKLPTPTDGVAYVRATKEVWVTTPRDHSLTVLDASTPALLKPKAVIKTEGSPEGYAVDDAQGHFLTNLEDKDQTLVIDVKSHKVLATYKPGCGSEGPRGLSLDLGHNFVIVACTDHVQVLDAAHDGAPLGRVDTGSGLDNLDYLESKHLLYAAAGRAARLTIARLDGTGQLSVAASGSTAERARNAVADATGNAYVPDPRNGQLLIFAYSGE